MNLFVRFDDIAQVVLNYATSEEIKKVVKDEDMSAFMSGLGIAATVIYARCPKYEAVKEAEKDDND